MQTDIDSDLSDLQDFLHMYPLIGTFPSPDPYTWLSSRQVRSRPVPRPGTHNYSPLFQLIPGFPENLEDLAILLKFQHSDMGDMCTAQLAPGLSGFSTVINLLSISSCVFDLYVIYTKKF